MKKTLLAILATMSMSTANAGIISISESSFSSDSTLIDFEDLAGQYSLPSNYGDPYGVTFDLAQVHDHNAYGGAFATAAASAGLGLSGGSWTSSANSFSFDVGQDKAGFWLGSNVNVDVDISIFGTSDELLGTQSVLLGSNVLGWYGFTSDTGDKIGSFSITGNNHWYISQIDNIRFETTAAVPEPASIALLGLGLAGIGFSRKKKTA